MRTFCVCVSGGLEKKAFVEPSDGWRGTLSIHGRTHGICYLDYVSLYFPISRLCIPVLVFFSLLSHVSRTPWIAYCVLKSLQPHDFILFSLSHVYVILRILTFSLFQVSVYPCNLCPVSVTMFYCHFYMYSFFSLPMYTWLYHSYCTGIMTVLLQIHYIIKCCQQLKFMSCTWLYILLIML